MMLPNHLAGGFVFTGFFAALAGINVLDSPQSLGALALGAMLPDIDHSRSLIGRVFLPLSRLLNRRYGHRTLTHSLTGLFLFSLASGIIEQAYFQSQRFTVIASLAYFSHIFLDMMTLQGVMLFYPMFKNPCVLPGQTSLRLRTGDLRGETFFFCTFLILGISMQDLYRQGFWNTYNRTFGTLKHLTSEFVKSPFLIRTDYRYREGSKEYTGSGFCLEASEHKATLITDNGFLLLDDSRQVIKRITPIRTQRKFRFDVLAFKAVTVDSLNRLLKGKRLMELELRCGQGFSVNTGASISPMAKAFSGSYLERANVLLESTQVERQGLFIPESDARITALRQEMRLLQQQAREAMADYQRQQQELKELETGAGTIDDLFEAQQTAQRIRELRKVKRPVAPAMKLAELEIQVQALEKEVAGRNFRQRMELEQRLRGIKIPEPLFNGHLRYVTLL